MNYALLVGVNDYKSPDISNLGGCENDVEIWQEYLSEQFGEDIQVNSLLSQDATRNNIIEGFQDHLSLAEEGELAFFYFSGHGCREPSPEEFWEFQKDKQHENIVCYDSLEGAEDIADKELQYLIRKVAAKGAEVVIIFDCCHSGSATRNLSKVEEAVRKDNNRTTARPKDSFVPGTFDNLGDNGKHLFISACDENQLSRERKMGVGEDAKWGGLFTDVLMEVLDQLQQPGMISYANLGEACRISLKKRMFNDAVQTPKVEAIGGFDANRLFLQCKGDRRRADFYTLSENDEGTWKVNLGRIQGLLPDKQATFSIFADADMKVYAGEVKTLAIGLYESPVSLPDGFTPLAGSRFFIPATYLPMERLHLWVPKDQFTSFKEQIHALPNVQEGIDLMSKNLISRQAFESAIYLTTKPEAARYGVVSEAEHWKLLYTETEKELFRGAAIPINRGGKSNFQKLAEALLHIAKWERMNHFENPFSGIEHEKAWQKINLIDITQGLTYESFEITLDHKPVIVPNNSGTLIYKNPLRSQINLLNSATIPLYCVSYYLSRHFQIIETTSLEIPSDNRPRRLDKGSFVLRDATINQTIERYTVIFSEEEIPYLNLSSPQKLKDILKPLRSGAGQEQKKELYVEEEDYKENWFTLTLKVKLLRELAALETGSAFIDMGIGRISFDGPSTFKAKISLSSSADHMQGPRSDRYLKEYVKKMGFELLDFSGDKKLETILEMHHIEGAESLQKEPLEICIHPSAKLPESELWALTLPEELDKLPEGTIVPEGEVWQGGFPILAKMKPSEEGAYTFELNHIPGNPPDGRYEVGKSLKVSFLRVKSESKNLELLERTEDFKGEDYLFLKGERIE